MNFRYTGTSSEVHRARLLGTAADVFEEASTLLQVEGRRRRRDSRCLRNGVAGSVTDPSASGTAAGPSTSYSLTVAQVTLTAIVDVNRSVVRLPTEICQPSGITPSDTTVKRPAFV